MTTPFISLTDLGNYVGEDLAANDLAIIAIDSACETVRSELDLFVNLVQDDTIRLDGTGGEPLWLPEVPVRDVSVITIYDGEDTTDVDVEDETVLTAAAGILYRVDAVWPAGRRNIEITYSHGWDVTEDIQEGTDVERVPSDIRRVALQLAASLFNGAENQGIVSETLGAYTYRTDGLMPGELSKEQSRTLAHYRKPDLVGAAWSRVAAS